MENGELKKDNILVDKSFTIRMVKLLVSMIKSTKENIKNAK